jgi:hypothetical protein
VPCSRNCVQGVILRRLHLARLIKTRNMEMRASLCSLMLSSLLTGAARTA